MLKVFSKPGDICQMTRWKVKQIKKLASRFRKQTKRNRATTNFIGYLCSEQFPKSSLCFVRLGAARTRLQLVGARSWFPRQAVCPGTISPATTCCLQQSSAKEFLGTLVIQLNINTLLETSCIPWSWHFSFKHGINLWLPSLWNIISDSTSLWATTALRRIQAGHPACPLLVSTYE